MTDDIIYGGSIDADRMQYAISATPKPKSQWSVGPDFSIAFCTTAPMPKLASPDNAAAGVGHPLEKD